MKILIADDHKIIRDGLSHLISKENDMHVIGEAADGREAVQLCAEMSPDIVIMDITMPELNGIDATRQILSELPETRIVALSMHTDKRFITGILKAGASGYLLKDCAFDELVSAIRSVDAGDVYLSTKIAGVVVSELQAGGSQQHHSRLERLSLREREVLQLLAEGKNTKEIASNLYLSGKTIESHRKKIMDKLNLHSIADLTKFAIREGLTTVDP